MARKLDEYDFEGNMVYNSLSDILNSDCADALEYVRKCVPFDVAVAYLGQNSHDYSEADVAKAEAYAKIRLIESLVKIKQGGTLKTVWELISGGQTAQPMILVPQEQAASSIL